MSIASVSIAGFRLRVVSEGEANPREGFSCDFGSSRLWEARLCLCMFGCAVGELEVVVKQL